MAIPDYQTLMLPVLQLASDGTVVTVQAARDRLAEQFALTPEDLQQLLPSGRQTTFSNRVAWAITYLRQAGLLKSEGRSRFAITSEGRAVLTDPPDRITVRFLERYPSFQEFRSRTGQRREPRHGDSAIEEEQTPEERLDVADRALRATLERDLLDRLKSVSPAFFERLVLELLIRMGYGVAGSGGEHLGRAGDDGVDGVIREDKLGLDVVYLQAKRWGDQPVRRPDVQAFAGSLEGQRAQKGVYITTSHFTADAHEFTERIGKRIVLIDGQRLAQLMIEHGVGLTTVKTYAVQRIDESFFDEASGVLG